MSGSPGCGDAGGARKPSGPRPSAQKCPHLTWPPLRVLGRRAVIVEQLACATRNESAADQTGERMIRPPNQPAAPTGSMGSSPCSSAPLLRNRGKRTGRGSKAGSSEGPAFRPSGPIARLRQSRPTKQAPTTGAQRLHHHPLHSRTPGPRVTRALHTFLYFFHCTGQGPKGGYDSGRTKCGSHIHTR